MFRQLCACATIASLLMLAGCREGGAGAQQLVWDGRAEQGRVAIHKYGCGSCHTIPGVKKANGLVGPPLTEWSGRKFIAGNLINEPNNLVLWIMFPDSVEPGTAMPTMGVALQEARDIAAHLYTIGARSNLGPPHLLPADWLHDLMPPHAKQAH